MSKKRYLDTKFWSDGYIEELDPTEKLLFLYLLTNERTNVAGVYELPRKIMAVETGIEKSMLDNILARFEADGKIITHKKWLRLCNSDNHQNIKNNNIKAGIKNVLERVPTEVKRRLNMTLQESSMSHGRPSNNLDLDLDLDLDLNNEQVGTKKETVDKPVEKAYYSAIKELDVPVRNHNNLRSKVKELENELGVEMAVKYLEFVKNIYPNIPDDGFKPIINEALEVHAKRGQIRSWVARMKLEQEVTEVI